MEVGTTLLYVILAIGAYMVGKMGFTIIDSMSKMSDCDTMNKSINEEINEENNQTWELLKRTLEHIGCGCQYEIDDNSCFIVKYLGEEFKIDVNNDKCLIWIYNFSWVGININDAGSDYLKQAINKANENSAITNLYTTNEEKGIIAAHCQMVAYFAFSIPNYRGYLKSILDSFYYAHQRVRDEFENLCKNQEQKERIEIKGFRQE